MKIIATMRRDRDRFNDRDHMSETIDRLIKSDIYDLRYNLSKFNSDEISILSEDITYIRTKYAKHPISIMLDIPYPRQKPRFFLKSINSYIVEIGTHKITTNSDTTNEALFVKGTTDIGLKLNKGDTLVYGDGEGCFTVLEILDKDTVLTKVETQFTIENRKAILHPNILTKIVDELENYISVIEQIKPESIALSFVEKCEDILELKDILSSKGLHPRICSKIETPLGVTNIDQICNVSDMVMVARGDLGLTTEIALFPESQHTIIKYAKKNNVDIIIATDFLLTMVDRIIPSRADIMDLYDSLFCAPYGIILTYKLVRSERVCKAAALINDMHKKYNQRCKE